MAKYNYHTATRRILGDLHTPVETYMKLRDLYAESALMESSDYHDSNNSRSFIALDPIASISVGHGSALMRYPDGTSEKAAIDGTFRVEDAFRRFLDRFAVEGERREYCGLYGYTTFNAVRYFENIPVKDSTQERNDAPDILYILYKYVIVFDHFNDTITLVEMIEQDEPDSLDGIENIITNHNFTAYDFRPTGQVESTLTDDEHRENIRRGIAHCMRGDVFQIV